MSNFIYDPPKAELSSVKNGVALKSSSLAATILPFTKVVQLSLASTFIGIILWVALLFITLIAVVLIDESIIDNMSNNMAVILLMGLMIPGSIIANVVVLLKLKSRISENGW